MTFKAVALMLTTPAPPDHATSLSAYRKPAGGVAQLTGAVLDSMDLNFPIVRRFILLRAKISGFQATPAIIARTTRAEMSHSNRRSEAITAGVLGNGCEVESINGFRALRAI